MDRWIDDQVAAIAAYQHGVIGRWQVHDLGGTLQYVRRRVRSGRWERRAREVFRLAGTPQTWKQQVSAAVLEAGPGSVASHESAAALLGIPGFGAGPVVVSRLRGRNARQTLGVLHETSWLPWDQVRVIDGIPCTCLARCVFDLAGVVHPARAERALENAMSQLGLEMAAVAEVLAALGRRGRPGTALVRELVGARGDDYVPTESELEALALAVFDAHGLPMPAKQVEVGGDQLVGRVDFLFRDARLVVEADGKKYHDSLLDRRADATRDAALEEAGWRVERVLWHQLVHEPEATVARIRRALLPSAEEAGDTGDSGAPGPTAS